MKEGRLALKAGAPDLVILDIALPDGLGTDLCREIRAAPATAALPILLFSVRSEYNQVSEALDCGAQDYLLKPFRPEDLVERVKKFLDKTGS